MSQISFNFTGKKAIVTGASRGIGRDVCRALAEANIDKIYAVARTRAELESLKAEFRCVVPVVVDLLDWNATRKAIDAIEPVDFLINNAANSIPGDIVDCKPEDFDTVMNLNVKAVINISQVVCPKMIQNGGGAVVNMSTVLSKMVFKHFVPYIPSKFALDGVTKKMAEEFAPTVRVNSVHPTIVWTELARRNWKKEDSDAFLQSNLLQRAAEMHEVSTATLFLLSSGASMCTGHNLPVDGGQLNCR